MRERDVNEAETMADIVPNPRCTRRKQSNPRKNGTLTTMLNNLNNLARCPHCGKLFRGPRSSLSLQEHITNIHVAIAPISKPEIASSPSTPSSNDTVVAQTIDFIDHQKPYICTKCKAPFEQKDHLEKHELLHSTQGQSCQLCNKSFANVYRLQRHMLSHDESQVLRKFKCPECLKAFKFKHHLKEHIRIHSGEKPFACPNCGKRFSHSGSYSSHMTSKKCLVVNLKIRKVDQTRSQRNRNFHSSANNGINNCLTSQSSLAKSDIFSNNTVTQTNARCSLKNHYNSKKEDSVPVLKSEINFPTLFLSPELQQCSHDNSSLPNYFPPNSYSSSLSSIHPALFSAAAASVGLPSPYFPNYSDMTNSILRSQVNIQSVNDIEISKENNKEAEQSEDKTKLENYDLNSMRKILQIVDATVAANAHQQSSVNVVNGSYGDNRSSNPSPLELSASSLHLPQIAPIDSPDEINKSVSNCVTSFKCKFCSNYFDNKIDLHQHMSFVCCKNKQNLSANKSSSSSEITKDYLTDLKPQFQSNNFNSSAAESDEESQRDSSLDDEVMMTDGKKVRVRSVLGEETLRILRAQYEINPRPKKHDILRLSEEVNYSPRVVQVWFQNMRARDRRLGRPIPSNNMPNELNLENCNSNAMNAHLVTATLGHTATHATLAEAHQLTPQSHSIGTPLMPISIPHYKPALNLSHSGIHSFPSLTPFQPEFNGISIYGRKQHNTVYYMNSSEFSITPYSTSDSHKLFANLSVSEEPLDLSVRNKSYLEDKTNNNIEGNSDSAEENVISAEALNLSQKSSKTAMNENSSDEILSGNISLAILKQQQRKDNEHNSIVRSMLMNKCGSDGSGSPVNRFNILTVNGSMQSPKEAVNRCSPPMLEQNCDKRESVKQCHSDCEYNEHHSDSNNPSDDYISASSPQTPTKLVIASPSKLFKGNGENVISREDQSSPTDASIQLDGPGLYTCDQCDKTFSKQSSLARHKYEHSGQRPHKCDVCNKAFKHKHHLTEHKRLHSGEKPFQCKKCLKRFSHSGSYSQHMNHRYSYCKPYRE